MAPASHWSTASLASGAACLAVAAWGSFGSAGEVTLLDASGSALRVGLPAGPPGPHVIAAGSGAAWWTGGPSPVGPQRGGLAAGLGLAASRLEDGGILRVVTDGQDAGPAVLRGIKVLSDRGVGIRVESVAPVRDLRLLALRVPARVRVGDLMGVEVVIGGRSPGTGPVWLVCGGVRRPVDGPGTLRFDLAMPEAVSLMVEARLEGAAGPFRENDMARAWVAAGGRLRVAASGPGAARLLGNWGAAVGGRAEVHVVCGRPPSRKAEGPLLLVGEPDHSGRWPLQPGLPGTEAWALAVDVSGSMDGARLAAVEQAVRALAASVEPDIPMRVVPFAREPRPAVEARDWLAPRGSGGTDLVGGLRAAEQELGQAERGGLVLLSDGNDADAPGRGFHSRWRAWAVAIGPDADVSMLAHVVGPDRVIGVDETDWSERLVALREQETGILLGGSVAALVPGLPLPSELDLGPRAWPARAGQGSVALFGGGGSVVVGADRTAGSQVVQVAAPAHSLPAGTAGLLAAWLVSGTGDLNPAAAARNEWSRAGELDEPGLARLRMAAGAGRPRPFLPAAAALGCCLLGLGAGLEGRRHRVGSRR